MRERGEIKKIVVGAKPEGCFMHAPPLHGEDARMNLKTLCNDVFNYWNQLHASSKYNRLADVSPTMKKPTGQWQKCPQNQGIKI